MNIDIFYVTYRKDADWFRWSTEVLLKNLTGYRRIIAVAPIQDRVIFNEIAAQRPGLEMHYVCDWNGAGYYWQQWMKMNADRFTDAQYICHVDSDVFFAKPVDIQEYFHEGKPGWLWAWYSDLRPEDAGVWKAPTERAFGSTCDREFMEGFPFIIGRTLYQRCREWLEHVTQIPAERYLADCAARGGASFSEFNFMGNVAWSIRWQDYHWVDRNREEWPKGFHASRQFWSHAPLADCMGEITQMLYGGTDPQLRVTNRGIWVLSNDTHISKWVEQQNRLDFDVPVLTQLCKYIQPGDVVVDVGAFIGDHTLAYARATHGKDGGCVMAFEPNEAPYQCLTRNMKGWGHVMCIKQGLSDAKGDMQFVQSPNVGASHLVENGTGVQVDTLDSWKLNRLNFLKIDAEGCEVKILRGGRETIMRCRPVMWIEVNAGALERAGTSAEELKRYLIDELRYAVYDWQKDSPQFDVLCRPAVMPT